MFSAKFLCFLGITVAFAAAGDQVSKTKKDVLSQYNDGRSTYGSAYPSSYGRQATIRGRSPATYRAYPTTYERHYMTTYETHYPTSYRNTYSQYPLTYRRRYPTTTADYDALPEAYDYYPLQYRYQNNLNNYPTNQYQNYLY